MKRLLNAEDILISFFYAVGYGIGYIIPKSMGKHEIFCILISIISGILLGILGGKFIKIWSKKSATNRDLISIAIVVIFILFSVFSQRLFDHSLYKDLTINLILGTVGISSSVFIFLLIVQTIKAYIIRKRYKDGSGGHVISESELNYIEKIKGDNKEIIGKYDSHLAVKTENGIFVAKKNKKVQEFLGIPYAKPPVGNLRWKAPVKPDPSDRVWEAYYFGDSPIQSDNRSNLLREHTQSEDCLTLNIWRGALKIENDKLKPVLVCIHGGDLSFDGSADPLYYGGNFVKKFPEIIVVSFNYRLGVFGFLTIDDVPWADEYTDSGNLGLMDQIMALNWVHDNIRSFGGDPDNVMLVGDTMGANCIKILSVLKESKDLFKKALLISVNTVEQESAIELPRVIFKDLMKELGVSSMSEMLDISSDVLKQFMADNANKFRYMPAYGKGILGINIEQAIREGETGDIKFIYGIPADEVSALLSLGSEKYMDAWADSVFDDIIKVYEGTKEKTKLMETFEKYKNDGFNDINAKKKTLEFWLYKYDVIRNCITLSDLGRSVKCFYWEVNSPVKKFGGNSVSMITTLLGNFSTAEEQGYLINNTVADVFQHLIYNELSKDNADLIKNQVRGVNEIKWKLFNSAYPMILHITDDNVELDDNILIEEIETIKKWRSI